MRAAAFRLLMSLHGTPLPTPALGGDVWKFTGSFYGVSAVAQLSLTTRKAHITLRGVPLGGTVQGVGWLAEETAESGRVVIDEAFRAALARRFVSIESASLCRADETVTVNTRLPLLGACTLVLNRQVE